MGDKFTIEYGQYNSYHGGYGFMGYWQGDSLLSAIWNFIKCKRQGHIHVVIHWREEK